MPEKQFDFAPIQKHVKAFEYGVVAVSLVCIVIVLIVTQLTSWGTQ